jgi:16S rRNA (cytosine1402-N4)-methyltransferase
VIAPLRHAPVLLDAVLGALAPRDRAIYVDGTFGAGGYSRALLAAAHCRVIAIDRDREAVAEGANLASAYPNRFVVLEGRFGDMAALLAPLGISAVDGIALDLGVSSPQLDDPRRGFSFRGDGPLDMRMGRDGASAADLVNSLSESALANLIYIYGEERFARRRSPGGAVDPHCRARPCHSDGGADHRRHRSGDAHLPGPSHGSE